VLSSAGQALAPALTSAFDQIDAVVRTVLDEDAAVLDVACLSTFAMRWLIPRLHRFYEIHPGIDVRLSTNERHADTPHGRFDLSIVVLDEHTRPNARDTVLFAEKLGVVLAPAMAVAQGITTLADMDLVPRLTSRTRANAWSIWRAANGYRVDSGGAKNTTEYEHFYFAIEAALGGLGACAVPLHLVSDDLASGRLIAPFDFIETGYHYVARQHGTQNKLASHFSGWLKASFA
jgi:LysR family transcriptional regulator, glycine cleavage system transcriptional activator